MPRRRERPTSAVCRRCFEPGVYQVGAKMEGFRLPLSRRGMRTTLVSGSQSLNEGETSPRHHEQRRASPVYSRPRRRVKRIRSLLRHDGIEQLPQCAEPGADVLLVDILLLPLVAETEQLVGDAEGGERQHAHRVLAGRVAPDPPRPLVAPPRISRARWWTKDASWRT